MNITDIKIFIRDNNQLKAFANIVIDDAFIVRNIKLIEGKNGLFVAMPSRKMKNGEFQDIAHPINSEARSSLEQMIIDTYNKTIEQGLESDTVDNLDNSFAE